MQIILKIKNMFKKMRNKIIYLKNENRRESNLQNLPFTTSGPQRKAELSPGWIWKILLPSLDV